MHGEGVHRDRIPRTFFCVTGAECLTSAMTSAVGTSAVDRVRVHRATKGC
ncbi:expressed unknown protein [Ectocarpus siliculosus]|uniref:Uncharacterized protein n=1 Tax=Ectocarpus siliculosus TaxID=2880 RepID=D8LEL6_ECTSI|nr:expressed unknown protein [Ectocarpus siliculosus]|eukprot:CBN78579.1 expressed unknown protein [Ectocarpus siliculosus]